MIFFCHRLLAALLMVALVISASEARSIPASSVTVTYDYDAFGNLIHSTGSTPNNYLFAGEQFDPDFALYYRLLASTQPYSSVPTARGFQVGQYAGQNLDKNFPGIDDFRDGIATQIKSTTQVETADQLLGVIRNSAQDLSNLEFPLKGNTASGTGIVIQASQVQGRALLVVIPAKPYDFDLRAVMAEIQEIANSERISIALQEVESLEGQ